MPALPNVGADVNVWGAGLNAFLSAHSDPATGELLDSAVGKMNQNAQTGTAYTLVNADAGRLVSMTNGSPSTLTIPTDASTAGGAMAVGTVITLRQGGAGQLTIVGASGVTLRSRGSLTKIAGQYGYATLIKVAANTWELTGDLA